MSYPENPEYWSKIATWIAGVAAALVALVWGDMKLKVNQLEAKLDTKADKIELDRQRDNVAVLFEGQTAIRREIQQTGDRLTESIHKMHVDLLLRIDERIRRRMDK